VQGSAVGVPGKVVRGDRGSTADVPDSSYSAFPSSESQ